MKSLKNYIYESVEEFRVSDLEVNYTVQPEEIFLQAPEVFQESDIQQYMDDMWINSLPSGQDNSEKFFGKNYYNIIDAHFEYDTFEHIDVEPKDYIKWDSKYDDKKTRDEVKLDYFKIKNLKYIISFDKFDLVDVKEDEVDEKIKNIFKATESNDANDYPIEIKFNEDNIKYKK